MPGTVGAAEDLEPPGCDSSTAYAPQDPSQESPLSSSGLFLPHSEPPTPLPVRKSTLVERTRFRSRAFRSRFFPQATTSEWNDWKWQLRNRIRTAADISHILDLSDDERLGLAPEPGTLPVCITPYYAGLLDPRDPMHPLRRTMVPVRHEHLRNEFEEDDPLHEDKDSPICGIVHRYPDRVLFLVTGLCAAYCRYCTRSRMVGHTNFSRTVWQNAISYIAANPSIRDVLLSGGDPLTLSDESLEWLLSQLHRIPHVEFLRLGTKVPVVLPQRITPALTRMLKRYHPLWMSIHFTHPDELTPESRTAFARLADAGIPLGSQTVLLAGVNDDLETMKRLMHSLLQTRVRPYYLYQCDPIPGSSHFRTPVSRGLDIIRGLRGHTSGYAVPTFVIDAPGGGGKIPLLPDYVTGCDSERLYLRNYTGNTFAYPDPFCNRNTGI